MLQSYSFFSTLRVSASAFKRFLLILVIHRSAIPTQPAIIKRSVSSLALQMPSYGGRNLIGHRTQSNRTANAI